MDRESVSRIKDTEKKRDKFLQTSIVIIVTALKQFSDFLEIQNLPQAVSLNRGVFVGRMLLPLRSG